MRDSNSRGVAPNTLSKSAAPRPGQVSTVCDLRRSKATTSAEQRRTSANETKTETRRPGACGRLRSRLSWLESYSASPVAVSDSIASVNLVPVLALSLPASSAA
jgi:hypothetical protein